MTLITFKELLEAEGFIVEELHPELKSILNEPERDRGDSDRPKLWQKKLNNFSAKVKDLSKRGEDSGMIDSKPKKGSSRAVFFPKDPKKITIDGVEAHQPTAVKIAFPGTLDKHTGDPDLLGTHQNRVEADHFTNHHYSMLSHAEHGGEHDYNFNPHGVVAPVLDHHEDHHWLEMAHADKMSGKKFTEMTKTESHPKGLNFAHFTQALQNDHNAAHGHHSGSDEHDHLRTHPLYENTQDFIQTTGQHPGDLRLQNYGVWKHPVTGKEYPTVRDFGYSDEVSKLYTKAHRAAARKANFG